MAERESDRTQGGTSEMLHSGDSSEELRMTRQQFKDIIAEEVRRALSENRPRSEKSKEPERSSKKKSVTYQQFRECNRPQFVGMRDVVATHKWLREMEAVIKLSECRDDQKVKFAAHSLVGEALYWWDTVIQSLGEEATDSMLWPEFKKLMIEKLCPQGDMNRIEVEFLQLQAGTMTHRVYTSKFEEMGRLVPHLVTPEDKRIFRYTEGLPSEVRKLVRSTAPNTYQLTVNLAADM